MNNGCSFVVLHTIVFPGTLEYRVIYLTYVQPVHTPTSVAGSTDLEEEPISEYRSGNQIHRCVHKRFYMFLA